LSKTVPMLMLEKGLMQGVDEDWVLKGLGTVEALHKVMGDSQQYIGISKHLHLLLAQI
jgi:hypothetical protein